MKKSIQEPTYDELMAPLIEIGQSILYRKSIMLQREHFKEQYNAGITRCLGYDIIWR